MASVNATIFATSGKGGSATVWTLSGSGGSGNSASDPRDINVGDTVTFIRHANSNFTNKIRQLSIFTDNSDIDLTASTTTEVRTVASGGVAVDLIQGTNAGGQRIDNLYLERQATDTTPSSFDFTNQTGVPLNGTRTTGNTVTIAGLSSGTSTSVSVSGGTYSKNGNNYTNANTTAVNGTTFKLSHTSSGSNSTSVTTTLTVGGVSGSFVSTTVAASADNTPNAFNIANITGNISPGTVATSASVTISGMDSGTACSVSGASSQLEVAGSGTFSTSSTINSGQTIRVRLTGSTSFSTAATCTLTIGTVTDTISVTTGANTSGSSGSGTTGGSGSYGVQVFDTNGSTSVLSPSTRYMTRLTAPASISINPGAFHDISCNTAGLSASNSQVLFELFASSVLVSITRPVGANAFRITNNSSAVFTNLASVVRF